MSVHFPCYEKIIVGKMKPLLFILILFCGVQSSLPSAGDDLNKLQEEYGEWRLMRSPEYATGIGNYKYNDQVESFAIKAFTEERDKCRDILNRLGNVPYDSLSSKQKTDYDIFNDTLQTIVRGYNWRNYNALNPVNFLEGPHVDPDQLPDETTFTTIGDYENYLTRLSLIPKKIDEMMDRFNEAIKLNHTYNEVSVGRVPSQIDELLKDKDPTHFAYYKPFNDTLSKNSRISNTIKQKMKERARNSVGKIIQKLEDLKNFINDTYLAHTRQGYGVSSWDHGREFYRECLRWHLSLDTSPDEVHQKGLSEVERISGKMRKIMSRLNHKGTVKQFFDKIKSNSTFTFKTREGILKWYSDTIHKTIQSKLPQYFKDLPNLPVEVRPNPIDGVGGQYLAGPADGSRPGVFQINAFHPTQMTTIDAMSLALHETNPGHHLQISIQSTRGDIPSYRRNMLDDNYFQPPTLPPFYTAYVEISIASTSKIASYRKNMAGYLFTVPFEVPFYTAYVEGWALYSEFLGEEMGLYKDDFVLMGRYSSEIFRACRLVVDTGLHYKNWSRQRAIDYMLNYTAMGNDETSVEIDRYLTWPGQACAYKTGELKIRELRTKSEKELGKDFDIKEFHHVVLKDGALPLNVLEKNVNQWIEQTKNQRTMPNVPKTNCGTSNSASKLITQGNQIFTFFMLILVLLFSL